MMLHSMKDLLLILKDMCESETPITLKSLLNSLDMIDEFKQAHITNYKEDYISMGYLKSGYYGFCITLIKPTIDYDGNEYDADNSDDVAIYAVPYENAKWRREMSYDDQILIIGIESKDTKDYDQEFISLTQNQKYIDDNFIIEQNTDIDEFIKVCKKTLSANN